ncbi:MAG: type IVB secretion system protein IcmH/DotU [Gammaproteobacteria bacterium]|nr:type IVB secretion system protein IcmH/DotU [Gammaproteobacteria bacterium]MDH5802701.1 type IVB secretion system protein IcmH/DotU [Gammaproteobacteria bacterium]
MSSDDPFNRDDADRTIIVKPNPGGQRSSHMPPPGYVPPAPAFSPPPAEPPMQQAPMQAQPQYAPPPQFAQPQYAPAAPISYALPENPTGPNVLTDAAARLLALVGRLKSSPHHNDVGGLHRQVAQEIQSFENNARNRSVSPEAVLAARYALCAAIDEAVLNTPWGSTSLWSSQSMLSSFHQETGGGEKFFQILDRIKTDPRRNIDLLELYSICLALGFEGRYRIMDHGRSQLESLKDELHRIIRTHRGDYERELSPRWRGLNTRMNRLRQVPFWAVATIAGAVMFGIYVGFNFILHQSSSPVVDRLENINPTAVVIKKEES